MPNMTQPVRGTHDLLPEAARAHRLITETARRIAGLAGFEEIATPLFEFRDVFERSVGETSDIVTKEMFEVSAPSGAAEDRAAMVLRPENTAGVCRAVVSNGLAQSLPLKFFYAGPMFRYERPQKGRLRQFHQIGIELIGAASPLADVEVIATGAEILRALGLSDKARLELNTLGDQESRSCYRAALVRYFSAHVDALSEDSRARLERNPLRILDSKDPGDRALITEAPRLEAHLTDEARRFFDGVRAGLDALAIDYRIEPRLVRGLDYYTHTTFEFVTEDLGAQGTVMAGGRYDGLIADLGGPPTPGVGWAAGVERLALLLGEAPVPARPVAIVPLGETAEARALPLAQRLRRANIAVDLAFSGNLKKRLARANKVNARLAVIFGDAEIAAGTAQIKDLDSGEQQSVSLDALVVALAPATPS